MERLLSNQKLVGNRKSPTARLIRLLGRFAGFEDFISQLDESGACGRRNHLVELMLRVEFVEDFVGKAMVDPVYGSSRVDKELFGDDLNRLRSRVFV
jgi:hypothetical protein